MSTTLVSLPTVKDSGPVDPEAPTALKPAVDPTTLRHKAFLEAPDWRRLPAYRDVTDEQFLDHHWQSK